MSIVSVLHEKSPHFLSFKKIATVASWLELRWEQQINAILPICFVFNEMLIKLKPEGYFTSSAHEYVNIVFIIVNMWQ